MKFLLFSDLHYGPGLFKTLEWEALHTFQRRAEETGCEMIIHAGDFCHRPLEVQDYIKAYNDFHIPSYHCLGNHDMDGADMEETVRLYNMPNDYYFFEKGGYRFVILNTSYIQDGDNFIKYSNANYFKYPGRDIMPPFEIEWLRETIDSSTVPCILISHVAFDRPNGMKNRLEVLDIINKANEKRPHSVLMCINGHHHRDYLSIMKGVIYYDMIAASQDWIGVVHDGFPKEECDKILNLSRTIAFNDPLHAIVTIEGTTVTVEGMQSSYYMGVDRERAGSSSYDGAGRPLFPEVQSFKVTV